MGKDTYITVVSGLPRSGTSLVMQLLSAGGMPVLTDNTRSPDADNPKGYFEYAPVKRLKTDQAWMETAQGNAVKIVSPLLAYLPDMFRYKVLFVERPLDAIIASQNTMIRHRGEIPDTNDTETLRAFEKHVAHIKSWLDQQPHIDTLCCSYYELLNNPEPQLKSFSTFLNKDLDILAMRTAIDPNLNHH